MFYVYYDDGSCNEGDHESGLMEFQESERWKMLDWIQEYRKRRLEPRVRIICGTEIQIMRLP